MAIRPYDFSGTEVPATRVGLLSSPRPWPSTSSARAGPLLIASFRFCLNFYADFARRKKVLNNNELGD